MQDKLVWIDCEMTGLRLESDKLIEIAALVTDGDLNILGEGVDVVIHADDDALANMPDVVTKMHADSGLTEEVRASTVTLAEAEKLAASPADAVQGSAAAEKATRGSKGATVESTISAEDAAAVEHEGIGRAGQLHAVGAAERGGAFEQGAARRAGCDGGVSAER